MDLGPFCYLRHGKTQANLDGLMCGGKWDIPLCPEGIVEVSKVAKALCKVQPRPSIICSSPLKRAFQTAEITAEVLGLFVEVVEDLCEWNIGEWDRVPFGEVKNEFLGGGEPKGGESRRNFQIRVERALIT